MSEIQASPIRAALRTSSAVQAAAAVYPELLQIMVLDRKRLDRDKAITFGKLLRTEDAREILTIFWRESSFVAGDDLRALHLPDKMEKGCNAYAVATKLAERASELAALNTQVRNIAVAAEQYDLVKRLDNGRAGKPIIATDLLNDFMLAVTQEQERQLADFLQR